MGRFPEVPYSPEEKRTLKVGPSSSQPLLPTLAGTPIILSVTAAGLACPWRPRRESRTYELGDYDYAVSSLLVEVLVHRDGKQRPFPLSIVQEIKYCGDNYII